MEIRLGTLEIVPAKSRLELVAPPTKAALGHMPNAELVGVAEIDPNLSDTAAFCAHYEVGLEQAANCVIVEAVRGERRRLAACMVLGNTRADVNGIVRRTLDARRASFAPMEEAVEKSGMEYGGITPIGLPADWPILIDSAVAASDYIIVGSGIRKSKLIIPGKVLAALPNATVIEGLGRIVEK